MYIQVSLDHEGCSDLETAAACCPEGFDFVGLSEGQRTGPAACLERDATGRTVIQTRTTPDATLCSRFPCCPEDWEHVGYGPDGSICLSPLPEGS